MYYSKSFEKSKYFTKNFSPDIFLGYNVGMPFVEAVPNVSEGKNPANSIWLWSPGVKPALPLFGEKTGLTGAVVAAVERLMEYGRHETKNSESRLTLDFLRENGF